LIRSPSTDPRSVFTSRASGRSIEVWVDEEQRFDELYRRAGPRLWRAVLAYTGGRRELTDDVVAEAFARTLERAASIRSFEPYLYRVAFRLAASELRRSPTVAEVPDLAGGRDQNLSELFDAMRVLSPGQRAAVFLRYQADLPVTEVARLMGTSSAVVRVHLMRGRRRLAELLGEDDD
jgi:RNA polymerase sigma-70 factor (ECF subfamily)